MKTIDIKAEILKMKETRSIKEIASDMGLSASTLYKYLKAPESEATNVWEDGDYYKYAEINWKSFKKIYNYVIPQTTSVNFYPLYFSSLGYFYEVLPLSVLAGSGSCYRFFTNAMEYEDSLEDELLDDIAYILEKGDLKFHAEQLAFKEKYKENFNLIYK